MPQIRNFADAHKVLGGYIARNKLAGSYSLERIEAILLALGNPQDTYKIIHVAGTSGKTSTCYYAAALLSATGKKVGLTVSPHVDEVNERVQINLESLAEAKFCNQLQRFIELVDETNQKPTYFELLVSFAYWEFAQQKVDYAVVEVGLGGLLDGTNVIHSPDKVCVITDIGLDHTNVLGNTIAAIATQKAGIIQDHNHVFMYNQAPEIIDVAIDRCGQQHAILHLIGTVKNETDFKQRNYYLAKNVFDFVAKRDELKTLKPEALTQAAQYNIPARMEAVEYEGRTIIIDGSHNAQKMAALVGGIMHQYPQSQVAALVSFVSGDSERSIATLQELRKLTNNIIITSFAGGQDTPKHSLEGDIIADYAKQVGFKNIKIVNEPRAALDELLYQPQDLLLVTGSFYLLNHIRPLILKHKRDRSDLSHPDILIG